jgi:hypothetical protein
MDFKTFSLAGVTVAENETLSNATASPHGATGKKGQG